MIQNFLFTLFFSLLFISVSGQNNKELQDFDFAVKEVENNYAGFPNLKKDKKEKYLHLKERLRFEVEKQGRIGCEAAGELFGWFNDSHLRCGMYSVPYMTKKYSDYENRMEYNPVALAKKVDDLTFLIRFPSCAKEDSTMMWVEKSIEQYKDSGCKNLIIDIRGNGGGIDETFYPYLNLVYDKEGVIDGVEMRNTSDHLKYIQAFSEEAEGFEEFIQKMKTSKDEFISLTSRTFSIKQDTVFSLPEKVAVIIDRNVASSGEQMIINMRACSSRVIVYGKDNTLGCLDYSNARGVNLPNSGVTMYIPMTRSCRLPNRGIDDTGISPDVRLILPLPSKLTDNIDEWTLWVAKDLQKR